MEGIYTNTWGSKTGLASWEFSLVVDKKNDREAILSKVKEVLEELNNFASCSKVSFTTIGKGDDTFVIEKLDNDFTLFDSWFRKCEDLKMISIDLDVLCEGVDNKEYVIDSGACIYIYLDGNNDQITTDLIFLLNVDIYFECTRKSESNIKLSKLNKPRLSCFIERILHKDSLVLVDVDAPSYSRMIDEEGAIL